jgi:ion channel-forming bestrophin family protein
VGLKRSVSQHKELGVVIGDKIPWRAVFARHAPWLALVFAIAFALRTLVWFGYKVPFTPVPLQIAGVSLAVFLAFRNSAAYDRWWEGRKLWGGLVNQSRVFARQVTTLMIPPAAETAVAQTLKRELVMRHLAFLLALKDQLRGQKPLEELAPYLSADELKQLENQKNVAAALVHTNGVRLVEAAGRGWLSDVRLDTIDRTLTEFSNLQGGCERLKSTPLPVGYRFFTKRFTRFFVVSLPFGLVENLGSTTIGVSLLVAFVFLVLESVGSIIEDPFVLGPNGLALNAICRTIEINLRQQLGDTELPPPVVAEHRGTVDVFM